MNCLEEATLSNMVEEGTAEDWPFNRKQDSLYFNEDCDLLGASNFEECIAMRDLG